MRVVAGCSGGSATGQPWAASTPASGAATSAARQHSTAAAARARLAAVVALVLLQHGGAAGATGEATAAAAAGHDCPQYGGSILDMPDTTDCRHLLRKMEQLQHPPCLPQHPAALLVLPPEADCCGLAASFYSLQCHCWSSQFEAAKLVLIGAVDAACAALRPGQQGGSSSDSGSGDAQGSSDISTPPGAATVTAAAAGGGTQLAPPQQQAAPPLPPPPTQQSAGGILRQKFWGGGGKAQQEPIYLHTAATGGAAAGAATGAAAAAGDIQLFVGVLSAGARRAARDAIRASWGGHPSAYRVRFFLARPANETLFAEVRAEAAALRDLVVLGHITEHYFNITHQTLEVLRMAAADSAVTHVLKVDDDSYVHFDRLLQRLQRLPRERLFLGNIEKAGGHPQRDPGNQWYTTKEEWPSERYPAWAHGAGYVLSADLAAELAWGAAFAASQGGHLFKLEDIALGSWLEWAEQQRNFTVQRVREKRFNFGGCHYGDIVSHYITPPQQLCMWAQQGQCRQCRSRS